MQRWYQQEAIDETYKKLLEDPKSAPVIVAPTGSGKSHIIAGLCRRAIEQYKGRVVVLQHRKELVEQNAAKIQAALEGWWKLTIYSAGLKQWNPDGEIVVAGIQSVYSQAELFGSRQLIIIDECHLVPSEGDGMYRRFLDDMRQRNPRSRVVGLTATPFRTGEGYCFGDDRIFTEVGYKVDMLKLIEEGYLSNLCSTEASESVDTSNLRKSNGEFVTKEMEDLFDKQDVSKAVSEIIQNCHLRHSIMIFASSVRHALAVEFELVRQGQSASSIACVFGTTSAARRKEIIDGFKSMQIRWLINVDVLTTGFDAPVVDGLAILRATASPGLYSQMVGRGMRIDPSKEDCLVLDFGQNIKRHGAIDMVKPNKKAKNQSDSQEDQDEREPGIRTVLCPSCFQDVPASETHCECGCVLPVKCRHDSQSDQITPIIGTAEPIVFEVLDIEYMKHNKPDRPPTLRVVYTLRRNGKTLPDKVSEWLAFESGHKAKQIAAEWWRVRSEIPVPQTVDQAVMFCVFGGVAEPTLVKAVLEDKYWKIVKAKIDERAKLLAYVPAESNGEEVPF